MNRVIHFEIHSSQPEKAAKFYRDVFAWDVSEWIIPGVTLPEQNRYWNVATGPETEPGINGGIVVRRGQRPGEGQSVNSYVCTVGVASLSESLEKALKAGGTLAVPKMPIPGIGWLAYCKDIDGNIFGLMQEDRSAK
jgi:uncharacterized protein